MVDRLAALQAVAMLGSIEDQEDLARAEQAAEEELDALRRTPRVAWDDGAADAGDARLRALVPLLGLAGSAGGGCVPKGNGATNANWATLATHLPGRTGRECRERWAHLCATSSSTAEAARAASTAEGESRQS